MVTNIVEVRARNKIRPRPAAKSRFNVYTRAFRILARLHIFTS